MKNLSSNKKARYLLGTLHKNKTIVEFARDFSEFIDLLSPLRIDILNDIDGVSFEEAIKDKQIIDIDGIIVNYIGIKDLIQNKEASGRDKNKADIKALKKLRSNRP